ncbi:MAG: HAD-IA family hydrolase [SAR324 cluster bacterium]|nr:HAD-IA family hydrolase [SAR324 cluster bacterium]
MEHAPLRLDGLIFDLDGTLIDSFADLATAINETRAHYGLALLPVADVTREVGDGTERLVARTVPVSPETLQEAHGVFLECYDRHLTDRTRPYPGAEAVLHHFRGKALGLASNKPIRQTLKLLDEFGWRDRFRVVLGGDSLPARKPDPLPIREFLAKCGLDPRRAAMVGDSPVDIRAGKAAGVWTVAAAYGNTTLSGLTAERPDRLIEQVGDLTSLIE